MEAIAGALEDVGLPADLIDYAEQENFEFDAELRASHKEGIDKVGQDVGTPVIAVPGPDGEQIAFFGPVVTPAPKGEEAAQLWDGTLAGRLGPRLLRDQAHRARGPRLQQPVSPRRPAGGARGAPRSDTPYGVRAGVRNSSGRSKPDFQLK